MVTFIGKLVTGVIQLIEGVIVQVTLSPLPNFAVVKVLLFVPAFTPFTCH